MDKSTRIYVAGHRGLAGAAILRELGRQGYANLLLRTHAEVNLEDPAQAQALLANERPEVVFLAAAKVGGILANNTYPVDFLLRNVLIEVNVIRAAFEAGVRRLIFLGSSCIYPRDCPQPIREDYLLTGPLESTNRPYALAKIAGIELCWAYNRQHLKKFLAAMPTNLYGPGDNYDLRNSHVLPALIRKMHEAKATRNEGVTIWGSGTPRREFLYSDDLARALIYLAQLDDERFGALVAPDRCPIINVGTGNDLTIRELAELVAGVVGWSGRFEYDVSKADGTPRKLLDVSRLNALGWAPATTLPEGISLSYADFLTRHGTHPAPLVREGTVR
jgi:GDP-L-fucose synthase